MVLWLFAETPESIINGTRVENQILATWFEDEASLN